MPTSEQIGQAGTQMKKYASMMNDLADHADYVTKLVDNDNLDEFERALWKLVFW
ncbi:MAG: hypothetical protein H6936_08605 [Burkholderiales bacterium]|nr:hypothetical protein [Burkholderiales bacterium]